MKIELEALSLQELTTLLRSARKQSHILAKRISIATARKKVAAVASKAGYTVEELFNVHVQRKGANAKTASRKTTRKVTPKYQNPDNKRETWTGRGSMPLWMVEKTKHGRSRMDFLIPGLAKPTAGNVEDIGNRRVVKASEA